MPIGRYVVPLDLLTKYPAEVVDILRLGAFANALSSVVSMSATSLSTGVGERRDTLQTSLLVASYLKEAIDILDQKRLWELIQKALAAGVTLPQPVEDYRKLFSRGRQSLYRTLLDSTRNKKGFHIDRAHFADWLRTVQAPEITLWQRDTHSPIDWAFTLSMQIQSVYGDTFGDDYSAAKLFGLAPHLVFLVEALCAGLVVEAGYNPRSAWRPTRFMNIRVEYSFRDGRPKSTVRQVVSIDENGDLTGHTVHALKAQFLAVFGALSDQGKTGYVLHPLDGALMMFNAPRGRADVWSDGDAQPPPAEVPTVPQFLAEFRRAALWGEHQAVASLKLIEAIRDGRTNREEVESISQQFVDSLEYWKRVQRTGDELATRLRATDAGSTPPP